MLSAARAVGGAETAKLPRCGLVARAPGGRDGEASHEARHPPRVPPALAGRRAPGRRSGHMKHTRP